MARAVKILEQLGVALNQAKTRIVHITRGFEFLGFKIQRGKGKFRLSHDRIKSKLNRQNLYAIPTQKSVDRFKDLYVRFVRRTEASSSLGASSDPTPRKRPNKGRQLPAEVVEGRASPKGKSRQPAVVRTLSRVATSIRLAAVRRTANGLNPFATDVRPEGGDPMQARRGYRIGANPTTQGVGERDDGPHSNKPTRRNAW